MTDAGKHLTLVVGAFVRRTLLGSVAQRVMEHAPCDVLVVA